MKVSDKDYYMDGYLENAMNTARKVIKKDWDMVFAIDGVEGAGKSVMAQQLGYYCDPTLTNQNIVFTPQQFKKSVMNSKKFQAVIYDEAYTGLSSRATMSLINRTLISMLAEIRQRNLFVFVVMPTFFDLDKYVALWRSRALIHVYTGEDFERGRFAFYNAQKKKELYVNGKKYYSYKLPRPNFIGKFVNFYTVNEEEYRKNKASSLTQREESREKEEIRRQLEDFMFRRLQDLKDDVPHSLKRKILAMPESTYYWKLKKFNELEEFS